MSALSFLFSSYLLPRTLCADTKTNSTTTSSVNNDAVTWISPSLGDAFGPGDNIVGRWHAAQSVVTPSFRLCMAAQAAAAPLQRREVKDDSNDNCGSTVRPTVQQSSGQYFISL